MIGDSISVGVGTEDPTGSGDASVGQLLYGGSTVHTGATVALLGVAQATYPDNFGQATPHPNPGYVPHIVRTALAAGFTSVRINWWGISGNTTSQIRLQVNSAYQYRVVNGLPKANLVVVVAGSNDSGTGLSAAFIGSGLIEDGEVGTKGSAQLLLDDIENAYGPSVRVVWIEPVVSSAVRAEADLVRAHIAVLVAAKGTRVGVAGAGQTSGDGVHPTLDTYKAQGVLVVPGYLAAD